MTILQTGSWAGMLAPMLVIMVSVFSIWHADACRLSLRKAEARARSRAPSDPDQARPGR